MESTVGNPGLRHNNGMQPTPPGGVMMPNVRRFREGERVNKNSEAETIIRCNFCSKRSDDVGHLISGPGPVYICDQCVDICVEILDERGYGIRTSHLPKQVDLKNLDIKPKANKGVKSALGS